MDLIVMNYRYRAVRLLLVYVHALYNDRFSSGGEDNRVIVRTVEGLWFLLLVCRNRLPCHNKDKASTRMLAQVVFFFTRSILIAGVQDELTGEGGDRRAMIQRLVKGRGVWCCLGYRTPLTWMWTWGQAKKMIVFSITETYPRDISITWPYHTEATQNATGLLWPAVMEET